MICLVGMKACCLAKPICLVGWMAGNWAAMKVGQKAYCLDGMMCLAVKNACYWDELICWVAHWVGRMVDYWVEMSVLN